MNEILQYLKKHGECSDKEIAEGIGISLADLHRQLTELAFKNQVMSCQSTKFVKGKEVKAIICRIAGFTPPAAPGRRKTGITISK
jgi:DeoR/GlpR family transcriptional regulator of sugar metabolism